MYRWDAARTRPLKSAISNRQSAIRSILIIKPISFGYIVHTFLAAALIPDAPPIAHIPWVIKPFLPYLYRSIKFVDILLFSPLCDRRHRSSVPLSFLFDMIGAQDPPPITHPAFFYGFAGLGLAWQVAFFIISHDPLRFRPMMIPSILEKIGYGGAVVVLYAQGRMHPQDLEFGCVDMMFAAL